MVLKKENKGKLWKNHDASIGTVAVGKKAHLEETKPVKKPSL